MRVKDMRAGEIYRTRQGAPVLLAHTQPVTVTIVAVFDDERRSYRITRAQAAHGTQGGGLTGPGGSVTGLLVVTFPEFRRYQDVDVWFMNGDRSEEWIRAAKRAESDAPWLVSCAYRMAYEAAKWADRVRTSAITEVYQRPFHAEIAVLPANTIAGLWADQDGKGSS